MNIFQTILEVNGLGKFLAHATHSEKTVDTLTVYPIFDEIVGKPLEYSKEDLPDVVKTIESLL